MSDAVRTAKRLAREWLHEIPLLEAEVIHAEEEEGNVVVTIQAVVSRFEIGQRDAEEEAAREEES